MTKVEEQILSNQLTIMNIIQRMNLDCEEVVETHKMLDRDVLATQKLLCKNAKMPLEESKQLFKNAGYSYVDTSGFVFPRDEFLNLTKNKKILVEREDKEVTIYRVTEFNKNSVIDEFAASLSIDEIIALYRRFQELGWI